MRNLKSPFLFLLMIEELKSGIVCKSARETAELAERIAKACPQAVIALVGDLGAGKTTFAKGLARGLGITASVKSPSYNVCLTYSENGANFVHIDAYRLKSPDDYENLLIDELVPEPRLICVEWPQIIADALPDDTLLIEISAPNPEEPDTRLLKLVAR